MSELRGHEPHCYYETEDCTCGYALQEARRDVESLTAALAAEREKCAALAAALEKYQHAIEHFGPHPVSLDDDTMYHNPDCTCDRCEDKAIMESLDPPPAAILAADRRQAKREALEGLPGMKPEWTEDEMVAELARRIGFNEYRRHVDAALAAEEKEDGQNG